MTTNSLSWDALRVAVRTSKMGRSQLCLGGTCATAQQLADRTEPHGDVPEWQSLTPDGNSTRLTHNQVDFWLDYLAAQVHTERCLARGHCQIVAGDAQPKHLFQWVLGTRIPSVEPTKRYLEQWRSEEIDRAMAKLGETPSVHCVRRRFVGFESRSLPPACGANSLYRRLAKTSLVGREAVLKACGVLVAMSRQSSMIEWTCDPGLAGVDDDVSLRAITDTGEGGVQIELGRDAFAMRRFLEARREPATLSAALKKEANAACSPIDEDASSPRLAMAKMTAWPYKKMRCRQLAIRWCMSNAKCGAAFGKEFAADSGRDYELFQVVVADRVLSNSDEIRRLAAGMLPDEWLVESGLWKREKEALRMEIHSADPMLEQAIQALNYRDR